MSCIELDSLDCQILAFRMYTVLINVMNFKKEYTDKTEMIKRIAKALHVSHKKSMKARYNYYIPRFTFDEKFNYDSLPAITANQFYSSLKYYHYQTCEHEYHYTDPILIILLLFKEPSTYKQEEDKLKWGII